MKTFYTTFPEDDLLVLTLIVTFVLTISAAKIEITSPLPRRYSAE
jgi:hypothetical protein